MEFRFTQDEVKVLGYARDSIRARLPLARFRADQPAPSGWSALGADGWLHACLGDGTDAPLELPLLAALAREAGAVAAGEQFTQNAWLLPRLCSLMTDEQERGAWLARQNDMPGFLASIPGYLGDGAAGAREFVLGAQEGFDRYELLPGEGPVTLLRRTRGGTVQRQAVAGLSLSAARIDVVGGTVAETTLEMAPDEARLISVGGTVLRSAALIGLAAEILDRTVAYVSGREQFGQPIGRFQAVKHMCADVYAATEVAWLTVLYAAARWSGDRTALDQAQLRSAATALDAARVGAQLHGGMGFTWESDLHWLLKAVLDGQLAGPGGSAAAVRIGSVLLEQA